MKKFIKSIIFLIIFFVLWTIIFKVLWLDKTTIGYFYDEPKKSLDIVYVGGSNVYAHYNTTLAYDLYGFTTGIMSSDSQPSSSVKYLLEESKKYQSPKLYIIDLAKVGDDLGNIQDGQERKVIDSLKNSKNRIDAIQGMLKYTNIKKEDYINYYFSFLLYHNKWKNINSINIIGNKQIYKGYLFSVFTTKIEPQEIYQWDNNKKIELKQDNKEVLEDLIEYIKVNKLNVLFVVPRRGYINNAMEYINTATDIIQKNGYEVLNFNILDDFKVDFDKDFYNYQHLNVYGATKYTRYFSKYLKSHYDLPDHRDDARYNSWKQEYERFKSNYNEITTNNFDDLLLE